MAMSASSPRKVMNNSTILILSSAVVSMQIHCLLPMPKVAEEVVHTTCDNSAVVSMQIHCLLPMPKVAEEVVHTTCDNIGAFHTLSCLIANEVDLPWKSLIAHSKHRALPRCQKVERTWLLWIVRKVHLLCVVEGVVYADVN